MTLFLNGLLCEAREGERYVSLFERYFPDQRTLAVRKGGRTLSLNAPAEDGASVFGITFADEEGRRVNERAVRFVFLLAVSRVLPGARVRVQYSVGKGIFISVTGAPVDAETVSKLEAEMRKIVSEALPFERRAISRNDAMRFFEDIGATDKVRLLTYRPCESFQLYACGGMLEYFYGEMPPSTSFCAPFALAFCAPYVVLRLPDKRDPDVPAELHSQPKLLKTFHESEEWCRILGCANVADLSEMAEKRALREFIRVNEALHEKSIMNIAEAFVKSGARLLLIAGPSSSGKTTLSHRLSIALRVLSRRPMKISLDDYYLNRDEIPRDENGAQDLEAPDTLDLPLLSEHLMKLIEGETVSAPVYDFSTGRRSDRTQPLSAGKDQPIIIEGIHALNERMTAGISRSLKFYVYVSALTTINLDDHNRIRTTDARLIRRLVRDVQFRGTDFLSTLAMWESVRRGEDAHIFPYQEQADAMFNSSLAYELAVLKRYAYPPLVQIPETDRYYTLAQRLAKILSYVKTADVEDEIPPNSILREFIGGNCFYREND